MSVLEKNITASAIQASLNLAVCLYLSSDLNQYLKALTVVCKGDLFSSDLGPSAILAHRQKEFSGIHESDYSTIGCFCVSSNKSLVFLQGIIYPLCSDFRTWAWKKKKKKPKLNIRDERTLRKDRDRSQRTYVYDLIRAKHLHTPLINKHRLLEHYSEERPVWSKN